MTKAERTRERILVHAARLFRRHGYHGVGIEAIMAAAGLTRGGFYAHFRSKEDLFVDVLRRDLGFTEQLRAAQEQGSQERALFAVQQYLNPELTPRIARGCTMVSNAADVARSSRRARRAFTRAFGELVDETAGLVDGADADARALVALATCVGAVTLARTLTDREMVLTMLSDAATQVLSLLGHGPD